MHASAEAALRRAYIGVIESASTKGCMPLSAITAVRIFASWSTQSRRRCGSGELRPGADVAAVGPVPAQMWQRWAQSRRRCGSGAPSASAQPRSRARYIHACMRACMRACARTSA